VRRGTGSTAAPRPTAMPPAIDRARNLRRCISGFLVTWTWHRHSCLCASAVLLGLHTRIISPKPGQPFYHPQTSVITTPMAEIERWLALILAVGVVAAADRRGVALRFAELR